MRLAFGIAIVIVAVFPGVCVAETDAEIAARASSEFQQGIDSKSRLLQARRHFSKATDAFRELHERGVRSPALYRNLGNAAVLADRWPEAVWAFHVGLKLDPNEAVLREHLAFARGKVIYPPAGQGRPDAEPWPTWCRRPPVYGLTWMFLAFYLLTWFAAACAFIMRRTHFFVFSGVLILLTAIHGALLWHELRQADIDRRTPLVVVVDNTDFYRGNGVSYPQHPTVPTLPRGMEARQQHRRGDWLQVHLSSGEIGWVHVKSVLIVAP
jgi:hypothetical protein